MDAGRELDALIAEKVMGKPWRKPTHGTCCTCQTCGWPNDNDCQCGYSEDIARAWEVVEKLDLFEYYKLRGCDPCWWIACDDDDSVPLIYGAATAPLAICLAALKTMEVTDAP